MKGRRKSNTTEHDPDPMSMVIQVSPNYDPGPATRNSRAVRS